MMPSASVRPRTPQTPTTGNAAYSETFAVSGTATSNATSNWGEFARIKASPTTSHAFAIDLIEADTAPTFNRDVMCVGNAENAIARVLFELRKPQPDNARALKLALSALTAVQLIGEVLQ